MNAAHTKGPWRVATGSEIAIMAGAGHLPIMIAEVSNVVEKRTSPNALSPVTIANANLLAAAPDLLNACKQLIPWLSKAMVDNAFKNCALPNAAKAALDFACVVIAKAEGREETPVKTRNPNCDGSHCLSETGEVRLLPLGAKPEHGNLIMCHTCFIYEMGWRADQNAAWECINYDLPAWQDLEVYKQ